VLHTDDLPNQERTTDEEIWEVSIKHNRIVITKDSDFLSSHLINDIPKKLLLVSTGNIINQELFLLFNKYFDEIVKLFEQYDLVEINNKEIIVHEKQ
jgi:predicted nuclease of predicted toxin-antitoxin system